MRKNRDREIIKLLDKKNEYLSKVKKNMDTIKDQDKDSKELWEALQISKKQDNGENISKQDSEKLNDVKKHYESFFQDDDGNVDESNITGGLNDAFTSIKEDKLALVKTVNELNKKTNNINKQIKEKISSLSDDSTEKDTKDKSSSILDDSAEEQPKHKKLKSSFSDDSAEKEIMEKDKKSSLVDDYADTSLEMPEIIDD